MAVRRPTSGNSPTDQQELADTRPAQSRLAVAMTAIETRGIDRTW